MTRRQFLLSTPPLLAYASPAPANLETPSKVNRLVLAASAKTGAFDEKAVDCPFVFYHHGRYYMTFLGFDGTGYQTGLASSADLLQWSSEGCILPRNPALTYARYNIGLNWILRENNVLAPGRLRKIDGRYLGVYHSYPNPGYEQGSAVIGLAWTTDLRKWALDPPILHAEDGAAWERGGLYKPCILEDRGTFFLFYNAKNTEKNWNEQTGFATSRDLKNWKRNPANPLIPNGGPGSFDERFASDPCVLRAGKQWSLFYFGLDAKGVARDLLAFSADFSSVEKRPAPLIDVGPPGSIDARYAHKPSIICCKGILYHFYCAVSEKNERGISVALSARRSGAQVNGKFL